MTLAKIDSIIILDETQVDIRGTVDGGHSGKVQAILEFFYFKYREMARQDVIIRFTFL